MGAGDRAELGLVQQLSFRKRASAAGGRCGYRNVRGSRVGCLVARGLDFTWGCHWLLAGCIWLLRRGAGFIMSACPLRYLHYSLLFVYHYYQNCGILSFNISAYTNGVRDYVCAHGRPLPLRLPCCFRHHRPHRRLVFVHVQQN